MQLIDVAYISDRNASVNDALNALQQRSQSALLFGPSDDLKLIWVGQLREALETGVTRLRDVEGEEVAEASEPTRSTWSIAVTEPPDMYDEMGQVFESVIPKLDYAAMDLTGSSASLMTRSERRAGLISSFQTYRCNGKTPHYFPRPSVNDGQNCPRLGCVTASGARSTVQAT